MYHSFFIHSCVDEHLGCLHVLTAMGLCYFTQAFSGCSEHGLLSVVMCRLLTVVASLVAEHGL